MLKALLYAVVLGSAVAQASASDIPFISVDDHGRERITYIPRARYIQGMIQTMNGVQDEALPALSHIHQGKQWWVRTIVLGIGVDVKIGFSPFFEFGITPRFKTFFSNAKDPVSP